jgi:hypothetical protein
MILLLPLLLPLQDEKVTLRWNPREGDRIATVKKMGMK